MPNGFGLTDDCPIDTVSSLVATLKEDDQAYSKSSSCPEFWHSLFRYANQIIVRDTLHNDLFDLKGSGLFVRNIVVEGSDVLLWSHRGR